MEPTGIVFNVQRFTIHDGPGMRTEFFLKGCPMRCQWCSNPESQRQAMELGIYKTKCLGDQVCGDCQKVCPSPGTLLFRDGKLAAIDYRKCTNCMACLNICPNDTIKPWGKEMTVGECMEIIRKDRGYYEGSGGGVTISGGDPLLQCDFAAALFKACKEEGFHTCFESDFHNVWAPVAKVLPYSDMFIADIKHLDSHIHKQRTGVPNEMILANLIRLSQQGKPIILRIPVIPGFNNTQENMDATADFILSKMNGHVRTLQLLSYMRLGEEKYASLNRPYPMTGLQWTREELVEQVRSFSAYFNSRGIHCVVGTREAVEEH